MSEDSTVRSVTLQIAGQSIPLRTDTDDATLTAMTDLLNKRIAEIQAAARTAPPPRVYLLAALTLAEELVRARGEHGALIGHIRATALRAIEELDAVSSDVVG
jgi:cell division protein ZapA (FtsZ GTPase activity inhibitor)